MTQQTILDAAQAYKQRTFKQIQDFDHISIHMEVTDQTVKTKEGKEFSFKEARLYDEEIDEIVNVRIPNSVLAQLKILYADNEYMTHFKVIKSGEGMNTVYTVKEVIL